MKRTDGLVQCKCREWRKPEELCMDSTCIYCEDVEPSGDEDIPSLEDLLDEELDMTWDLNHLPDGYMVDDDDEFEHDW